MNSLPRSGYTLPVFACAAAIAALQWLREARSVSAVAVDLIEPAETVQIPIEQVAGLKPGAALAITRSDPGDNLDLTRDTPIWAMVERVQTEIPTKERILINGGEGIGRFGMDGQAAIYSYAKRLLTENLERFLEADEVIQVTLILPQGRQLAKRTSNEAFGVVEGLSLLGTSGIAQPLSAPGQLEAFRQELQHKARQFDCLVFCVGENGLDLAAKMGIDPARTIKTANWLGSLLVEAGLQQVKSILLFGYHGKLIKLAGGIFHTHHHVADGRLEILAAHCVKAGLPVEAAQAVFESATAEDGLKYLRNLDATIRASRNSEGTAPQASEGIASNSVQQIYGSIAETLDRRCQDYIYAHSNVTVHVGSLLFDRSRQILVVSRNGSLLLEQVC